ncbi:MAG: hypothetical protein RJA25_1648 [Bacteroidota bacterium]|jgi:hypothetical protein
MKHSFYIILCFITFSILSCKKENIETDKYEYTGTLGDILQIKSEINYTPDQIKTLLPSDISSFTSLKHNVTVYIVEYKSLNLTNDTVKASGIIIIPQVDSFSIPLLSYQHGTLLQKSKAPSVSKGTEYLLNLAMASDKGMVACVPDYLGLGTGDGLHLYLNPREEANSVRDILRAARKLVKDKGNAILNGQVFLYGYSQGGHATMAAQRQLELENSKEFKLTASAPMAGPYAMSRTSQFDIIFNGAFYPNPFYLPYVAVSIFHSYPNLYHSYSQIFKHPYDSLIPIIYDGLHSTGYANSRLDYYVSNMIIDSVKTNIQNNPNHPIRLALRGFDLVDNWTPTTPMKLYHCSGDDNVFYDNSTYADSVFKARGANIELIDMGSSNHVDCAPLSLLMGVSWFNDFIKMEKIK